MNPLNDKKKEFQQILIKEGAEPTIQALKNYLHENSPKYQTILSIEVRRNALLSGKHKGIHDDKYVNIEQNKIIDDLLGLINELKEGDNLPPSPKKKLQTTLTDKRTIFAGVGALVIISLIAYFIPTSSILQPPPYIFDIEGQSLAFRSNSTIIIRQKLGEELSEIFVEIDDSGDFFEIDTSCQCWKIDLERYHLNEGKYDIKIAPNHLAFQDFMKHTQNSIKIDNSIAEGLWTASSKTEDDSTLVEVKGVSNEKVNLDITFPFAPDSVKTSFQIIEDTSGFYFFQEIKIPNELVAQYKDKQIPIFISDDAGNQVGSAITLDMLEKGNVPPMFFGDHYKYFAESNAQIVLTHAPIEPQQQAAPQSSQPPPSSSKDDSLTLRVAFFSQKMIGLEWQLKNAGNREIEYTLYKRIAKGILKDTISDFVKVDYFSTSTYNDSAIKEGYVYEYFVEARNPDTDRTFTSNNVRRGIPPALQKMAQQLQQVSKPNGKIWQAAQRIQEEETNGELWDNPYSRRQNLQLSYNKIGEALKAEFITVTEAISTETISIFPWKSGNITPNLQKRIIALSHSLNPNDVITVEGSLLYYETNMKSFLLEKLLICNLKNSQLDSIYYYGDFRFTIKPESHSYIKNKYLRNANLYGVRFNQIDLRKANLQSTNLQYANLWKANLQYADLRGADLRGADLGGADLKGANLGGANLGGADLRGADLRGTNLEGAKLLTQLPSPEARNTRNLINRRKINLRGAKVYTKQLFSLLNAGIDTTGIQVIKNLH